MNFPRVIIRLQSPLGPSDCVVIGIRDKTISRFGVMLAFRNRGPGSVRFPMLTALLCAGARGLTTDEIVSFVYGDDPDGGPLNARNVINSRILHMRPELQRLALSINFCHPKVPRRFLFCTAAELQVAA